MEGNELCTYLESSVYRNRERCCLKRPGNTVNSTSLVRKQWMTLDAPFRYTHNCSQIK